MFELHLLGTSAAKPAHGRDVSGAMIISPIGGILVDPGEGFQQRVMAHNRRLKKAGMPHRTRLSKAKVVVLTHCHLDHCWGIFPMLHTMSLDGRTSPLTILAPTTNKTIERIEGGELPMVIDDDSQRSDCGRLYPLLDEMGVSNETLGFEVNWHLIPVDNTDTFLEPYIHEGLTFTPIPTVHRVPSCAWHIHTGSRTGRFFQSKAEEFSLNPKEIRQLAEGSSLEKEIGGEQVTLNPEDFRGPPRKGVGIVISGDTAPTTNLNRKQEGSVNLLLHEATYSSAMESSAREYLHSTSEDAARCAISQGGPPLVLTHFSPRWESTEGIENEARAIHPQSVAGGEGDIYLLDGERRVRRLYLHGAEWLEDKEAFK